MKTLDPGIYIDNSSGIYSSQEICENLIDLLFCLQEKTTLELKGEFDNILQLEDDNDREQAFIEFEDELIEVLNDHTPELHSFELYDGCYICALCLIRVEDAVNDGEAIKVSSLPDYLVEVNDHGNMTVYSLELKEVGSLV